MPRPKHWPYVIKRNIEKPRFNSLRFRGNKLILNSKELKGVKFYELKRLDVSRKFSELKVTLLVELV
jgi:hypothetical protein